MDTKIIAALAVVIIVVAGAGVALTTMGNGGDDDQGEFPETYLPVLGNANNDMDIDSKDVTAIEKFIADGTAFKKNEHCLYDANFDGKVDADDVAKVRAMIAAQASGNWSAVGKVFYRNVDKTVTSYDMTKNNKVITLIAPPLDTVLALGGQDLVVGFDNRITTGKYYSEYARTFDFSKMIDVGSCNEPDTEKITNASIANNGVNVVCGTIESYGPNLEKTFAGTDVQVIRIASWEYGETLIGFFTAAYLLKHMDQAKAYYETYAKVEKDVQGIVKLVPDSKKAAGFYGTAAVYGYNAELSLLGKYTGEQHNLMKLGGFDSATSFLKGTPGGGHGDTITNEDVVAMYQNDHLKNLLIMVGTPFQVKIASGDAQSSQKNLVDMYNNWGSKIGVSALDGFEYCVTGYSFSSGVSEYINEMVHCYYMYNDQFLAYYGVSTQAEAQDILADCVDGYCKAIGIDDLWSFYGEENGGKAGTIGMNLLYCGEGDERNILYGIESGSLDVDA